MYKCTYRANVHLQGQKKKILFRSGVRVYRIVEESILVYIHTYMYMYVSLGMKPPAVNT